MFLEASCYPLPYIEHGEARDIVSVVGSSTVVNCTSGYLTDRGSVSQQVTCLFPTEYSDWSQCLRKAHVKIYVD